jgi:hypothetical protein
VKNSKLICLLLLFSSFPVLKAMEKEYLESARKQMEEEIKESSARSQKLVEEYEQSVRKAIAALKQPETTELESGEKEPVEKEKEKGAEPVFVQESALEELPTEVKLSILGQLGNSVEEALGALVRLSGVDTNFRKLLKDDPATIGYLIKQRFSEEEIKAAFKAILASRKYHLIRPLTDLQLLPTKAIINLLLEQLIEGKPGAEGVPFRQLEKALHALPIDPGLPVGMHAIAAILNLHKTLVERNPQDRELISALYEYLITSGLIKINQEYWKNLEHVRAPLYWAVKNDDRDLFDLLIKLGADTSLPVNADAVRWAKHKSRGWL